MTATNDQLREAAISRAATAVSASTTIVRVSLRMVGMRTSGDLVTKPKKRTVFVLLSRESGGDVSRVVALCKTKACSLKCARDLAADVMETLKMPKEAVKLVCAFSDPHDVVRALTEVTDVEDAPFVSLEEVGL